MFANLQGRRMTIGPLTDTQRLDVLRNLQRNGAAVVACECGCSAWMPPEECYLSPTAGRDDGANIPKRLVVALTCAHCGYVKLYDPIIARALPDFDGEAAAPMPGIRYLG